MINVRGDVVDHTQTWPNLGVPYVLTGGAMDIEGASSPVLTLLPGTELRVEREGVIHVGANAPGGLVAVGTAPAPIVFTAHSASPVAGHWEGIDFRADALSSSRLDEVVVEWAGGGGRATGLNGNVMVDVDKGAFITRTTFRSSADCGVVRTDPFDNFATDFTAAELENTFESTPGGAQCGPR